MTHALTPRHVDIVRLMAQGMTAHEVAQDLGLSPDTIKTHLKTIYYRLGARNGPHAVLLAVEQGYLEPERHDRALAVA